MKRKAEIAFGQRFVEELRRLFPDESLVGMCRRIGCCEHSFYAWEDGSAPGAMFLAKIIHLGGDIHYVLTGRRRYPEPTPDFLAEFEEEYD